MSHRLWLRLLIAFVTVLVVAPITMGSSAQAATSVAEAPSWADWHVGDVHVHAAGDSGLDGQLRCANQGVDPADQQACARLLTQETLARAQAAGLEWMIHVEHGAWLGLRVEEACIPVVDACVPYKLTYDEAQGAQQWNAIRAADSYNMPYFGVRPLMGQELGTAGQVPCIGRLGQGRLNNFGHFSAYYTPNYIPQGIDDCSEMGYVAKTGAQVGPDGSNGWGAVNHPDNANGGSPWHCWNRVYSPSEDCEGTGVAQQGPGSRQQDDNTPFRALEIINHNDVPTTKTEDNLDALLMSGVRVALTGGTDSHTVLRDPSSGKEVEGNDGKIGLTGRTFVQVVDAALGEHNPESRFDPSDAHDPVREAIKAGRTVASNGPKVLARLGTHYPGETALMNQSTGELPALRIDWQQDFKVMKGSGVIPPDTPADPTLVSSPPTKLRVIIGPQGVNCPSASACVSEHRRLFEYPLTQTDIDRGYAMVEGLTVDPTVQDAYVRVEALYHGDDIEANDNYLDGIRWSYVAATSPIYVHRSALEDIAGCTTSTLERNDDGSTAAVPLPFTANFYSNSYNEVYVNNNGNVTFNEPLRTYTPFTVDTANTPIIAPFFADVDTRNPASGVVTYGSTTYRGRPTFCVNWFDVSNGVGYFSSRADKTNSFQLLLVDRSDRSTGDFDIYFNYGVIEWETGSSSGGFNGFGGASAAVGFSAGDQDPSHFFSVHGSLIPGSFPDPTANRTYNGGGLVYQSANSSLPGRQIYAIVNGAGAAGDATLQGRVIDPTGDPVVDAPVQVCPADGGACVLTTFSLPEGRYYAAHLPPGDYSVTAYPPATSMLKSRTAVAVHLGQGADVTVDLGLAAPLLPPAGASITSIRTGENGIPVVDANSALTLQVQGCLGATGGYTITTPGGGHLAGGFLSGILSTYDAHIPPLAHKSGLATVVVNLTCRDGSTEYTSFDIYIDPSGRVRTQAGTPIAGATVTLLRADTAVGPFAPVPDGSRLMSPINRQNPMTTSADGHFGWDVVAGYYKVRAEMPGCHAVGDPATGYVESEVRQIPPAVFDLDLVLACPQPAAQVNIDQLTDNTLNATEASTMLVWHAEASGEYQLRAGGTDCTTGTQLATGTYTAPESHTDTIERTALAEGTNEVRVCLTAPDAPPGSANVTVIVDTRAPTVTAPDLEADSDTGPSSTDDLTNATALTFTGTTESGAQVNLTRNGDVVASGAAQADGSYRLTDPNAGEGSHIYAVTATDTASNTSAATTGLAVVVDRTQPGLTLTDAPDPSTPTTATTAAVAFTADEQAVFTCRLDETGPAPCTTPVNYNGLEPGSHTVTLTATDTAGNTGSVATSWTVQASTSLAYTGAQQAAPGAALTLAAQLSSPSPQCLTAQPVTFSLDRDPLTGSTGSYDLGGANTDPTGTATTQAGATTNWQDGIYTLTTRYAGSATCAPSTSSTTLTVARPGQAALGAGWYTLPGSGRVDFGFALRRHGDGSYRGQLALLNNGKWFLNGTLTGYTRNGTSGTATGSGDLYYRDSHGRHDAGRWRLAQHGIRFTASFTDNTNKPMNKPTDTFGIRIDHTPRPPQPTSLPNAAPVTIKAGNITVR